MPDEPERNPTGASPTAGNAAPAPPVELPATGLRCPRCGYDVRGLPEPRCPECGFDLRGVLANVPSIPWEHRQELGAVRAYLRTVWWSLRRPRKLAAAATAAVSWRDARAFRWRTTGLTVAALVITTVIEARAAYRAGGLDPAAGLVFAGLFLSLLAVILPGALRDLVPRRRMETEPRSRAVAVSYYIWTPPLLWWVCVPLVIGLGAAAPVIVFQRLFAGLIALLCLRGMFAMVRHAAWRSPTEATVQLCAVCAVGLVWLAVCAALTFSVAWLAFVVASICW
jgi:hypothetical protein